MTDVNFVELFGDTLVSHKGDVQTEGALENKIVGIYFSAHWCPPCQRFTPMLKECYDTLKANGKNFEVVFVSSDKDAQHFQVSNKVSNKQTIFYKTHLKNSN